MAGCLCTAQSDCPVHGKPCRYQSIVAAHPNNVECLRYLVRLSQDLGRASDASRYADALRRAERAAAAAAEAASRGAQQQGGGGQQGYEGDEQQQQQQARDDDEGSAEGVGLDRHIAARAAQSVRRRAQAGTSEERKDGDVWAGEKLGDDLLPM